MNSPSNKVDFRSNFPAVSMTLDAAIVFGKNYDPAFASKIYYQRSSGLRIMVIRDVFSVEGFPKMDSCRVVDQVV